MIEEMKFLNIIGPKQDIDRVIEQYISKFDFQPENALLELKNVYGLHNFEQSNPYRHTLEVAEQIRLRLDALTAKQQKAKSLPVTSKLADYMDASRFIEELQPKLQELDEQVKQKENEIQDIKDKLLMIEQFSNLDYDLSNILHFKFIKFRFGRVEKRNYEKLQGFSDLDSIFIPGKEDEKYIWAVYFVPDRIAEKVDAIYSSLHFERFYLPDLYQGTPVQVVDHLRSDLQKKQDELHALKETIAIQLMDSESDIHFAQRLLKRLDANYNIRRFAAVTREDKDEFYILCGWMTKDDTKRFQHAIEDDAHTFIVVEKNEQGIASTPPTKLKNHALFRPFELFVEMYGLPSYKEFDPTILIAVSYSLLFGFMFGDVGQGALLFLGGLGISKLKKSKLAGIIASCGFFSMIFGLMFGSVFGFEDVIEPMWLRPSLSMTSVPGIGNLNTVFVFAIATGMGITLFMMILNIISRFRFHEKGDAFFGKNGFAGLVFYLTVVISIVLVFMGKHLISGALAIILFVVPLVVIVLEEPLSKLLEKKKHVLPSNLGMFFTQGFFELVEVLLSYFSNTLSFVRVGAFAISHAAMMEVVLMLAGYESGNVNWLVVILGNLFVCGMEGLIVGIQVLRLEYYELFSRFYKGGGKAFTPLKHEE